VSARGGGEAPGRFKANQSLIYQLRSNLSPSLYPIFSFFESGRRARRKPKIPDTHADCRIRFFSRQALSSTHVASFSPRLSPLFCVHWRERRNLILPSARIGRIPGNFAPPPLPLLIEVHFVETRSDCPSNPLRRTSSFPHAGDFHLRVLKCDEFPLPRTLFFNLLVSHGRHPHRTPFLYQPSAKLLHPSANDG